VTAIPAVKAKRTARARDAVRRDVTPSIVAPRSLHAST
jgi:hypothetical protein